jgi:hypothetical protein
VVWFGVREPTVSLEPGAACELSVGLCFAQPGLYLLAAHLSADALAPGYDAEAPVDGSGLVPECAAVARGSPHTRSALLGASSVPGGAGILRALVAAPTDSEAVGGPGEL